jgi:DNA-binding transcriptional ArsR family regulator
MQIPANHQEILDELAEKLLSQEASLTVKQVAGSLDASVSETKLTVDRAYNFLREMKLNEVTEKRDQDYMYNWIRSKSGK